MHEVEVRASKRKRFTITKINLVAIFKEITAVYRHDHIKSHIYKMQRYRLCQTVMKSRNDSAYSRKVRLQQQHFMKTVTGLFNPLKPSQNRSSFTTDGLGVEPS
jgi:hypothetical protein